MTLRQKLSTLWSPPIKLNAAVRAKVEELFNPYQPM